MKSFRTKLFRRQEGFTLVEMAIVLIIIGIILGAVLKGQDLITNARAKKLTTTLNSWSMLTFGYMDRLGRFPGDASRNGIIGDVAATERTVTTSSIAEIETSMTNVPENSVSLGGSSYFIYFGNGTLNGAKNLMVVCTNAACTQPFTTSDLQIMQSVDTAIDGLADAGLGQIRGATAVTSTALVATPGNRAQRVVTAVTVPSMTSPGVATPWATTMVAAVWLFDKPF